MLQPTGDKMFCYFDVYSVLASDVHCIIYTVAILVTHPDDRQVVNFFRAPSTDNLTTIRFHLSRDISRISFKEYKDNQPMNIIDWKPTKWTGLKQSDSSCDGIATAVFDAAQGVVTSLDKSWTKSSKTFIAFKLNEI